MKRVVHRYAVDADDASLLAEPVTSVSSRLTREFEANLRAECYRALSEKPGCLVLSGLEQLTESAARRFTHNLACLLGEIIHHDDQGGLIRDVVDRGTSLGEARTVRYSDTRSGGNPHTDGCNIVGRTPDIFALFCVRQAAHGGCLQLVHIDDVMRELAKTPRVIDLLRMPVLFDTRRAQSSPTVQRPVLEAASTGLRINYMRAYIDSAYTHEGAPHLSADQRSAFGVLDELLKCPDLRSQCCLRRGEVIIVNNRSVLHSRDAFENAPGELGRLLLRVWIAAPSLIFDRRRGNSASGLDALGDR